MNFAYRHVLWSLLIILPALVVFFWWAGRERQRPQRWCVLALRWATPMV